MGVVQWSGGWLQRCRESRSLVLVIVAIALLLDNMLLTTVGEYFQHSNQSELIDSNYFRFFAKIRN